MKKSTRITLIGIIIFIIAIVSFIGYTYFGKTQWETFENDFFTFHYPRGAEIYVTIIGSAAMSGEDIENSDHHRKYYSKNNTVHFWYYSQNTNELSWLKKPINMFTYKTMFFIDAENNTIWQISVKNIKYPDDLKKIADTFLFKTKRGEGKLPKEKYEGAKAEGGEWEIFENDFFTLRHPRGLEISARWGMVPGIAPAGISYYSKTSNGSFQFGDWSYPESVAIVFSDYLSVSSGWQISIKSDTAPGNLQKIAVPEYLQKIADTIERKPKQNIYKNPEVFANDPEILKGNHLWEGCAPVSMYETEDFFDVLISDMEIQENRDAQGAVAFYSIQKPNFRGNIEAMCSFSSPTGRVIMLAVSSDRKSSIAILEYDIPTRTALIVVSERNFNALSQIWEFDGLKETVVEMTGVRCYALGEKKIPCWRSTAVYDLLKREIRKISEERFTPELGL